MVTLMYVARHSLSGGWVVAVAVVVPAIDLACSRHAGRTVGSALTGALRTVGLVAITGVTSYAIWFVVYCGLLTECYR